MAFEGRAMKLSAVTYARVTRIKDRLEQEKQRAVSLSEVIDLMADHWDATERLVRDAREAGR